jgi:hypothetical protein
MVIKRRFMRYGVTASLALASLGTGITAASAAPLEAPQYSSFGMAVAGGKPALLASAVANGLPVQWARLYVINTVPASFTAFPGATAALAAGETPWLSLWLDPTQLAAGTFDTALAQFAATVPAGVRLTLLHEPSTHAKNISVELYKAAYERGAAAVQVANPAVLLGPIDVQFNVIRYHFLDTLDPRFVQFVGIDAYDGINGVAPGKSLQTVASAALAHLKTQFPLVPVGFAEFNSSRTVGRAQWAADALSWGQSVGATPMLLFTAKQPYTLTAQEQKDLAALIDLPVVPRK